MSAHVKVYTSFPDVICLEKDEPSVLEAIRTVVLTFNRDTGETGRKFVDINGHTALSSCSFRTFYSWTGSCWAQIHNLPYYFNEEENSHECLRS